MFTREYSETKRRHEHALQLADSYNKRSKSNGGEKRNRRAGFMKGRRGMKKLTERGQRLAVSLGGGEMNSV